VGALEFVAAVISSLVWPAVLVVIVLVFRKQLKTVLQKLADRLKKISGGGFEAEFDIVKDELETKAMLKSLPPIYGGTVPPELPLIIEADEAGGGGSGTPVTSGGHRDRDADINEPPSAQVDPKVLSLLVRAKSIVQSQPREAVLNAGRALERSIASTLDSLGIPYGADAKGPNTYVPAIFALRNAEVVDGIQAESLEQLYKLYRSATHDSADEVTAFSALQYIMLVEKEVEMLAGRLQARSKQWYERP
jgi:hypothetical protein